MGGGGGDATAQPDGVVRRRSAGSLLAALAVTLAPALAACGKSARRTQSTTAAPRSLTLSSPAFAAGGPIPRRYTCDGGDVSLPLRWSGVPQGTQELVVVMRDSDAAGGAFLHWALAGIPPMTGALAAGSVPAGATAGRNSFGTVGYRGPCPPPGGAHHYLITLSALAARSGLMSGFSAGQLQSRPVASGTLTGIYARR